MVVVIQFNFLGSEFQIFLLDLAHQFLLQVSSLALCVYTRVPHYTPLLHVLMLFPKE